MKRYFPHILIGLALIDAIVLLYLLNNKTELGISLMHPATISCGVAFIILFMSGVSKFMKRMD